MDTWASAGTFKEHSKSLILPTSKSRLPPLDVQQEIVAEIESYQKVIDGARAVVENYRPHIHMLTQTGRWWQLGELFERIQ